MFRLFLETSCGEKSFAIEGEKAVTFETELCHCEFRLRRQLFVQMPAGARPCNSPYRYTNLETWSRGQPSTKQGATVCNV
jgi:hypothetical protein